MSPTSVNAVGGGDDSSTADRLTRRLKPCCNKSLLPRSCAWQPRARPGAAGTRVRPSPTRNSGSHLGRKLSWLEGTCSDEDVGLNVRGMSASCGGGGGGLDQERVAKVGRHDTLQGNIEGRRHRRVKALRRAFRVRRVCVNRQKKRRRLVSCAFPPPKKTLISGRSSPPHGTARHARTHSNTHPKRPADRPGSYPAALQLLLPDELDHPAPRARTDPAPLSPPSSCASSRAMCQTTGATRGTCSALLGSASPAPARSRDEADFWAACARATREREGGGGELDRRRHGMHSRSTSCCTTWCRAWPGHRRHCSKSHAHDREALHSTSATSHSPAKIRRLPSRVPSRIRVGGSGREPGRRADAENTSNGLWSVTQTVHFAPQLVCPKSG